MLMRATLEALMRRQLPPSHCEIHTYRWVYPGIVDAAQTKIKGTVGLNPIPTRKTPA